MVAVATLFAASRASAADLPVPQAPAYYPVAAVDGGGYIGINGGLVGVTMGVSGQWGAWVFGVEGDFDWQGLSGTSSSTSPFCNSIFLSPAVGSLPGGLSCRTQSNWIGTLRARAGYAWDRLLVYGTVGGAGANVEVSLNGLPTANQP